MARLLRIDSSSRLQGSQSRELADVIESQWLARNPSGEIVRRDLVKTQIPHIADLTIAGYYTPKEQHTSEMKAATALSDGLIAELISADALLISLPVYNFSIPSALKAYIDQIVKIGRTFSFDNERGFSGLIKNKNAYVAAAYGGAGYFDSDLAAFNFLEPYLKALLGFLGITDVTFFSVEGTSINPSAFAHTRERAIAEIARGPVSMRVISRMGIRR